VLTAERQHQVDVGVRARNDVHADQLAHALRGALTGLGRRLHRRDVAADDGGHVAAADLLVPDQLDAGRLHHRVRGFDHTDEALGLDHSQCISHLLSPYLSTNFSGALPVIDSIAALAALAAESISDSVPLMYRRPNAPNGVTDTRNTRAAFSASL